MADTDTSTAPEAKSTAPVTVSAPLLDTLTPEESRINERNNRMTTNKKTWRSNRDYTKRKDALLTLLENVELRPQDRLNAEAMLQSLDASQDAARAGRAALREVDVLRQDNAVLTGEVERLKADLEEALSLAESQVNEVAVTGGATA